MLTFKLLAATTLTMAVMLTPSLAANEASGETKQTNSRIINEIKAFAHDWYARFDKGTTVDALAPNLVEENLEFVFPQATLKSLDQLKPAFENSWANTKASAHEIEEVFVHPTNEPNLFDVIGPHKYFTIGKDGSSREMDIVGRMKVRTGVKTKLDPQGALPKIEKYMVIFENVRETDVTDRIASLRKDGVTHNDVKSFVHRWYSKTDAKDADALLDMTSNGPLNIDLLGSKITDKEQLKGYFAAVSDAQAWATHKAHNIVVRQTEEGFSVRFVVHFEGDVKGSGIIKLTNVTNWLLILEDGKLRLRDYTLQIL